MKVVNGISIQKHSLIDDLLHDVFGVLDELLNDINKIESSFDEFVTDITQDVKNYLKQTLHIGNIIDDIKNGFEGTINIATEVLTTQSLTLARALLILLKTLLAVIEAILQLVDALLFVLTDVLDDVLPILQVLLKPLADTLITLIDLLSKALQDAEDFTGNVANAIETVINELKKIDLSGLDKIKNNL